MRGAPPYRNKSNQIPAEPQVTFLVSEVVQTKSNQVEEFLQWVRSNQGGAVAPVSKCTDHSSPLRQLKSRPPAKAGGGLQNIFVLTIYDGSTSWKGASTAGIYQELWGGDCKNNWVIQTRTPALSLKNRTIPPDASLWHTACGAFNPVIRARIIKELL